MPPDRKTPIGDFGQSSKAWTQRTRVIGHDWPVLCRSCDPCVPTILPYSLGPAVIFVGCGRCCEQWETRCSSVENTGCLRSRGYTVIHRRFADFPPLISAQGAPQDSHSVAIAAMREFMKRMRTQLESAAYPPNVLRRYAAITRRDNAARVPYLFLNRTGEVISAY